MQELYYFRVGVSIRPKLGEFPQHTLGDDEALVRLTTWGGGFLVQRDGDHRLDLTSLLVNRNADSITAFGQLSLHLG